MFIYSILAILIIEQYVSVIRIKPDSCLPHPVIVNFNL